MYTVYTRTRLTHSRPGVAFDSSGTLLGHDRLTHPAEGLLCSCVPGKPRLVRIGRARLKMLSLYPPSPSPARLMRVWSRDQCHAADGLFLLLPIDDFLPLYRASKGSGFCGMKLSIICFLPYSFHLSHSTTRKQKHREQRVEKHHSNHTTIERERSGRWYVCWYNRIIIITLTFQKKQSVKEERREKQQIRLDREGWQEGQTEPNHQTIMPALLRMREMLNVVTLGPP